MSAVVEKAAPAEAGLTWPRFEPFPRRGGQEIPEVSTFGAELREAKR